MASNRPQTKALRSRIDRLTPAVRRQVEAALARLRDHVDIGRLLEAAARGDELAFRAASAGLSRDLAKAAATVQAAFAAGAAAARDEMPVRLQASLSLTSPEMVSAAELSTATLVTDVTRETRAAIRDIIVRAFRDGLAPRDAAKFIRPLIGLTRRDANAVLALRAELLAQGLDLETVRARITRYAATLLRRRALTIARTEIIKSAADGQLALWQQARAKGFVPSTARKRWIVTLDDRLCPYCAQMRGARAVVPLTEPFQTPLGARPGPPMHPNCRCALALVLSAAGDRAAA